jgi:hypothetical protein
LSCFENRIKKTKYEELQKNNFFQMLYLSSFSSALIRGTDIDELDLTNKRSEKKKEKKKMIVYDLYDGFVCSVSCFLMTFNTVTVKTTS